MGKLNAQGTEIVQSHRVELAEVRAMLKTAEDKAALESQQKDEHPKRWQRLIALKSIQRADLYE